MALRVGALGTVRDPVTVELRLPDAAGITEGAIVAVSGVEVGEVRSLRLDHDVAVATLALERSAGLRADAAAKVRQRSVLGEKYLEIVPQSREAALLVDGDVLDAAPPQTEIDEMVSAVGPLVASVDAEAVGEALTVVTTALTEDPERVSRMLAHLEALLADSAAASARAGDVLDETERTLAAVRRTAANADARLAELRPPLAKADALLTDAAELVPPARRSLDAAERALAELELTLADLDGAGTKIQTVLDNLTEIDKWELRRLLREEGILIRIRPREVELPETEE